MKKSSASEIQRLLFEKNKYKNIYPTNYILSHKNTIACFYGKTAYLTNDRYYPLLSYESTSYINACSVSHNSKYMIIQTAYNKGNDELNTIRILGKAVYFMSPL